MAWQPGKTKPIKGPKPPKIGKKGSPKYTNPTVTTPKKPAAKKPKAVAPAAPTAAKPWYDPSQTAARDASIAEAFANPLKPLTGATAQAFAKALAESRMAPVMLDYDRQQGLAASRATEQGRRQSQGTAAMRDQIAQQLAAQQASQAKARDQIAGAGAQLAQSVDQSAGQAQQAVAADAATRGGNLDGGSAARAAQEAATAKARGAAGSQIALDQQASQAASGDQLLNQISAATAQQGGERQGAITAALNAQLRDLNQSRAKDLTTVQGDYVKTLLDLQGQNIQTNLATETLGLNKAKASADSAIKAAQLEQQAKIASLNAKIKVTEGAEQRKLRKELQAATDKQRALDRAARTETADKNRSSSEKRAATTAAARDKKAGGAAGAKLTPQDKKRRDFVSNVSVAQESGQLANVRKQAKNPSDFRRLLAEKKIASDPFTRQLLADLAYGGLKGNTIAAYKARYGRNPPSGWKRFQAPKPKPGRTSGVAAGPQGSIADALREVGK